MARVEVDEGRDALAPAVSIDGVGIMGGIQEELLDVEFRKVGLHGEEGMQEGEHVMAGGPLQEREYREIAVGIGGHEHVEVVAKEIAFPVGIPSPVTVGLGIMAFTVTRRTAFLLTIASALFALLCGSTDRGAVAGKSQAPGINQPPVDGLSQELLLIKPENEEKGILRL